MSEGTIRTIPPPAINLERCTLRTWRRGGEASLVHHANNRKIWLNLRDAFPHPYPQADADDWIRRTETEVPQTTFAIVVGGSAVGGIGLTLQPDVFRRSLEVGFRLGEDYWGRGIMTEALTAVTEYAFATFDVCRIFAGVFETNPASMRVLEKAGYSFEARLKKAVTKGHASLDQFIYARTR